MDVTTALVSPIPVNDRIVTSRVACVDSPRESSPVPREASFHAEATTIIDRTRAFEPIFIEDTTEKICPPARSKISRFVPPINETEN